MAPLHSTQVLHTLFFVPGMASLFNLDELVLWETAQWLHSEGFSGLYSYCLLFTLLHDHYCSNLELTLGGFCFFEVLLALSAAPLQ